MKIMHITETTHLGCGHRLHVIAILLLLAVTALHAAGSQVQDRLTQCTSEYEKKLETVIQPDHTKAHETLDQHYLGALKTLSGSAPQADTTAIQMEVQRLEDRKPLPPDDSSLPPSLTKLRQTYRKEVAKLEADRARKVAPLRQQFIAQLQQLRASAVKSGNAADVSLVDEKLAALGVSLPGAPQSQPSDAAATKELLEWCIRQKAAVSYLDGSKIVNLDLITELPKTRVQIKAIQNIDPTGGRRYEVPTEPFPYHLLGNGANEIEVLLVNSSERFGPSNSKDLQGLPALKKIYLALASGTVADFAALPTLPNVTAADFQFPNSVPEVERDAVLLMLLQRCPRLTYLGIGKHTSPTVGQALASMPQLRQLQVRGELEPGFYTALARSSSLQKLMTFDTQRGPSADEIRLFNQLEGFVFHGDVTDHEALSALASLPKLECLTFGLKHQTPETIRKLSDLPSLTWLRLRDVPADSDVVFETLGKMKRLKKLALSGPGVTAPQMPKLSHLRNLEQLYVDQTNVGPEPINALTCALPKLKQLAKLGPWP